LVNLDCLYGTWSLFLSHNATTTCSKNVSDLFINAASFSVIPSEPVFLVRSDPAKSTKCNLPFIIFSDDSTLLLMSIYIV